MASSFASAVLAILFLIYFVSFLQNLQYYIVRDIATKKMYRKRILFVLNTEEIVHLLQLSPSPHGASLLNVEDIGVTLY